MYKNNKYEDLPGFHHFYLGGFLGLVGFFLIWVHWIPSLIVSCLALWICIDDYVQHMKNQIIKKHNRELYLGSLNNSLIVPFYKKEYVSFLHRKFSFFWKFKIVRKITGFFDRLFGRG